ncbi:biotin transporter BioY [Falsigemmobacter faecalis]|uniref:Biotin transporter n=1 Tax=Falsigemmobacter faecalis TaxID=2488730 RepID=A0A3P3DJ96_9RHOB|nr:biotin transporter BioY [Falsigemmobacter faecalis]RRH74273.1 biotin transporter BioY [Falsigemmobacter faecalis]
MSIHSPAAHPLRRLPLARELSIAFAAILLLALSARVQVPFWPVPMTLQTLTVMGLGLTLGARRGAAITAGYLLAGLAGMPVFAGAMAGPAAFMSPTAGFLMGMPLMAAIAGLGRGRGALVRTLALIGASFALYAAGLAWLSQFVAADRLLAVGLLPFLVGDSVKIALCALFPAISGRFTR